MRKILFTVYLLLGLISTGQALEMTSKVMGDAPNFAQTSNGNFLAVVSRQQGRGAKAGALVEFFYPNYARDHLWDAYNGIFYNGRLSWFHDLELVRQTMPDDTGIVYSEFKTKDAKLVCKTWDVALHDCDTLVRHVEITNQSKEMLKDLRVFFYELFTVNYLGTGDLLRFDRNSKTLLHSGKDVFFTIGSDKPADQWQVGKVGSCWFSNYDARLDASDGVLRKNTKDRSLADLGVNGALGHTVPFVGAGETISLNYFISVGKTMPESWSSFQKAKQKSWATILTAEKTYWQTWLAQAKPLSGIDDRTRRVFRRALITMKQDTANNGAILAAPTLTSPVYGLVWPRDGSLISLAYLEAGFTEEPRRFIDFILKQQKPNGGWAVNFFCDGSRHLWDFGDRKNEHDQVGMVIWIIYEYYRHTQDLAWLSSKWPAVQKAADFLSRFMTPKGLIGPCRDLWELDTDKTWTFTNAAVYAGFKTAAEIAGFVGNPDAKSRYMKTAITLQKSVQDQLWSAQDGYFVRGIDIETGTLDRKLEAANLALGYPFDLLPYHDLKLKSTAEKVYTLLASSRKGIRRYSDDPYYGGQPWPVTTDWLAIHFARTGDLKRARQLHQTVTDYAFETESLLLGEQFDEQKKLWVSALPLTWSEAKYVLATLDLFSSGQ